MIKTNRNQLYSFFALNLIMTPPVKDNKYLNQINFTLISVFIPMLPIHFYLSEFESAPR